MTEINPCNCSTCTKDREYQVFARDCPFNGFDYTAHQVECMTMRCGCLYHPNARENINLAVIEKLESLKVDVQARSDHAHEIEAGKWCGHSLCDGPDAELKILKKVIKLIKKV